MLKGFLQRLGLASSPSIFEPRMPEVEESAQLAQVFDQARAAASGRPPAPPGTGRHVVIVTPGRVLMFQACPPPGSMPAKQVASIEQMISPKQPRNIAVIAFTELAALQKNISNAIPFLGMLMGFAYVGHAVWIFEGHPSAIADGCRDADVLLCDGGMLPHLSDDWQAAAASVMRKPEIYVHDRATFRLRPMRVAPTGGA